MVLERDVPFPFMREPSILANLLSARLFWNDGEAVSTATTLTAVQPMLDPRSIENDARPVPLARRTSGIPGVAGARS